MSTLTGHEHPANASHDARGHHGDDDKQTDLPSSPSASPGRNSLPSVDPVELHRVLSRLAEGDMGPPSSPGKSDSRNDTFFQRSARAPAPPRPAIRRNRTYDGGSSLVSMARDTPLEARVRFEADGENPDQDVVANGSTVHLAKHPAGDWHDDVPSPADGYDSEADPEQALSLAQKARRLRKRYYESAASLVQRHCFGTFSFPPPPRHLSPECPTPRDGFSRRSTSEPLSQGILSNVLRLYGNHDRRGTTPASSTATTPACTPPGSPGPSPSPSRRNSFLESVGSFRVGGGASTPRHRRRSSQASVLSHLARLSNPFAGADRDRPPPNDSSAAGKKCRRDRHYERIRITKHIADIMSRHRYLAKLCRALIVSGAPTHRLEEYMSMSARVLGIDAQFLYMPNCMVMSFDDPTTHTTEVKLVRTAAGLDLGRMSDVHKIYKQVVHDRLSAHDALAELEEVVERKDKFHRAVRVLGYGVASATVAPLAFEGRPIDMPFAFVLGCLVGFLQLVVVPWSDSYAHVSEVSCAILTTLLARAFGSIRGGTVFCFGALAQSSIALILPGYIVLVGSMELQSRNLVAGGVRIVYALIYTLFLGYGMTIGASLYGIIDQDATSETHCRAPLPRPAQFAFVVPFCVCLCVINQAKWRQVPFMLLIALAGYTVSFFSSAKMPGNKEIATSLGALAVGLIANASSRLGSLYELRLRPWWDRHVRHQGPDVHKEPDLEAASFPQQQQQQQHRKAGHGIAAAAMLPAIFVLVPSGLAANGSLLEGVNTADRITNGLPDGTATALGDSTFRVLYSVIRVAIGLSAGLFLSVLIWYPKGKKRSGVFTF